MALTKLGDYISLSDERNTKEIYQEKDVVGLSTQKHIIKTKADLTGVNLSNYKIFRPHTFAYVADTSRRGEKIALSYNDTLDTFICSSIYTTFYVSSPEKLLPKYLFMYFNRPEFDRYARFHSWGSARETFSWGDLCNISIDLPSIETQKKYVAMYHAMQENQHAYEQGLDDLKLCCDAFIENLRKQFPCEPIGPYIERKNHRNFSAQITHVMGLSTQKEFRPPQSRVNLDKLDDYKIVAPLDFVFVPTTDTWKVLAFAVNYTNQDIVVSPIYEVFSVDHSKIIPQYLALWLSREDFDRYARFHSWGSARENFDWSDMCHVKIPIPPLEIQQSIVHIYEAYRKRKQINERLKAQLKDICPILIRGSLKEAKA